MAGSDRSSTPTRTIGIEALTELALDLRWSWNHSAGASAEPLQSDEEAMVRAACQLAAYRGVDVIVTVTRTGEPARVPPSTTPRGRSSP